MNTRLQLDSMNDNDGSSTRTSVDAGTSGQKFYPTLAEAERIFAAMVFHEHRFPADSAGEGSGVQRDVTPLASTQEDMVNSNVRGALKCRTLGD